MDDRNARKEFSRAPTVDDLVLLCKNLNEANVKYIIIGGFAIIHYGYIRTTGDIDLLVDSSKENIEKIKKALLYLSDKAVKELDENDVTKYSVVRVADEIVIDLMEKACEVDYKTAKDYIEYDIINGVKIPYLKPDLLIKTKLSYRPKDIEDKIFLEEIIKRLENK